MEALCAQWCGASQTVSFRHRLGTKQDQPPLYVLDDQDCILSRNGAVLVQALCWRCLHQRLQLKLQGSHRQPVPPKQQRVQQQRSHSMLAAPAPWIAAAMGLPGQRSQTWRSPR